METFSALLALCEGNALVTSGFPSQRPVTQNCDAFFDQCLNKRLSKQLGCWWFEMPSHSLWCHCNESFHWKNAFDHVIYKIMAIFSQPQWVTICKMRPGLSWESVVDDNYIMYCIKYSSDPDYLSIPSVNKSWVKLKAQFSPKFSPKYSLTH